MADSSDSSSLTSDDEVLFSSSGTSSESDVDNVTNSEDVQDTSAEKFQTSMVASDGLSVGVGPNPGLIGNATASGDESAKYGASANCDEGNVVTGKQDGARVGMECSNPLLVARKPDDVLRSASKLADSNPIRAAEKRKRDPIGEEKPKEGTCFIEVSGGAKRGRRADKNIVEEPNFLQSPNQDALPSVSTAVAMPTNFERNRSSSAPDDESGGGSGSGDDSQCSTKMGSEKSQRRRVIITSDEALIYIQVIVELLKNENPSDVLRRVRRDNWNWELRGKNLMTLIMQRDEDIVPFDRAGKSMKNYFKTHLGTEDSPGEIPRLFTEKLAAKYTTDEQKLFTDLISSVREHYPGTPQKRPPQTLTFGAATTTPKKQFTNEEIKCIIKGVREALAFNVPVKDLTKELKGEKWKIPVNAQGQPLIVCAHDFIRQKFDQTSERPISSYKTKWRALVQKKNELCDLAKPLFSKQKYDGIVWEKFNELVNSFVSSPDQNKTSDVSPDSDSSMLAITGLQSD